MVQVQVVYRKSDLSPFLGMISNLYKNYEFVPLKKLSSLFSWLSSGISKSYVDVLKGKQSVISLEHGGDPVANWTIYSF